MLVSSQELAPVAAANSSGRPERTAAGAAALPDREVMEALRKAGLADDVAAFPMGLETFVSEEGGTLSGGQRQRIMIARALVGNPAILFFDEATSALDNRTQAVVRESLHRLNVTRLAIAHRLSTVRNADKILVLDRGRLVESGRYDELMERAGAFFRLAERQLV
jgi:ABC-type bacteriocin/lantibiotic exporter with double-glycine peptidase domain